MEQPPSGIEKWWEGNTDGTRPDCGSPEPQQAPIDEAMQPLIDKLEEIRVLLDQAINGPCESTCN